MTRKIALNVNGKPASVEVDDLQGRIARKWNAAVDLVFWGAPPAMTGYTKRPRYCSGVSIGNRV